MTEEAPNGWTEGHLAGIRQWAAEFPANADRGPQYVSIVGMLYEIDKARAEVRVLQAQLAAAAAHRDALIAEHHRAAAERDDAREAKRVARAEWEACAAELTASNARIAAALAVVDAQVEAFVAGNPARPNEYGYYLLQEIRAALGGVVPPPTPDAGIVRVLCNALYALQCPHFERADSGEFIVSQLSDAGYEISRSRPVQEEADQ